MNLEVREENSVEVVNPLFQEGWKLVHVCSSDSETPKYTGELGCFRYVLVRGSTFSD